MTLDPAIFRALVAQGATPEMLLAVVEAAAAADEDRRARKRANNAERQARFRSKRNANNADNALPDVTERDIAAVPAPDKESPQTPKEINPTPGVCGAPAREAARCVSVRAQLAANRLALAVLVAMLSQAREHHVLEGAVELWNAMARRAGLATVKGLTDERRKRLRARLAEHGPDAFTEAIDAVERSPFCRGESNGGWRADFDFLLQASSFTKLIEGSYDRASRTRSSGPARFGSREDPIFAARRNIGRDHVAGVEPA